MREERRSVRNLRIVALTQNEQFCDFVRKFAQA